MSSPGSFLIASAPLPELRSRFCWSREGTGSKHSVCLFRGSFDLAQRPASLRIAVTADNRYILSLNGVRLGRGPWKGTLEAYQVETYELVALLRKGRNVLTAEVRWAGEDAAMAELHSQWPGWWVQSEDRPELNTPGKWRVFADESVQLNTDDPFIAARQYLGPHDKVDAALRPAGWMEPEFNDEAWALAVENGPAAASEGWGLAPLRRLVSRDLPALLEEPRMFSRVFKDRAPAALPWSLGADEGGEIWLDAGALTTSYPVLEFKGGRGRHVRFVYAEALGIWQEIDGALTWRKFGRRDDVAGRTPHGYHDALILPGGRFVFEPFHWRCFWFLKVEILPGAEPVELAAATHRFTTFPHTFSATFECDQPEVTQFWEISLRTLQLCAHETYEDCPYFEQLNYVADSQLQALCTQYLANDTRLARRCLELFRDSLGPEGIIAGRAPSRRRQLIPGFSLHWILMLRDHWDWEGAPAKGFVRSCLGAVDSILAYFRGRLTDEGFIGDPGEWAWLDLVPGWTRGTPKTTKAGTGSTYFTALFVCALEAAGRLHRETGIAGDAERWVVLAERLRRAMRDLTWSESRGLFLEGPGRPDDQPTQHTQTMAILANVADARIARLVGDRLASDPGLVPMSLFHRFHLARALETAGRYDVVFSDVLAPWRLMVNDGLTTWLESTDPSRSDCHGWSSWMVYDFFASVLGVRPAAPGWTSIRIQPQVAAASSAHGAFHVPTGAIRVRWSTDATGNFDLTASTPVGVPVTVVLPDGSEQRFATGGSLVAGWTPGSGLNAV